MIADFDFDVAISNRVIGTDALPKALWPRGATSPEPDPMAECWRASFSTELQPENTRSDLMKYPAGTLLNEIYMSRAGRLSPARSSTIRAIRSNTPKFIA
jgi:hypothetical protein